MSHTDGPWKAWKYPDTKTWTVAASKSVASKIEKKEDAQLIAAAPELLYALECATTVCGCSIEERLSGHKTDCLVPDWLEIIDKARGEK